MCNLKKLLLGLIGITIGGYMLKTECIDEYGRKKNDCQANHKNDSLGKLGTFSYALFVIKNIRFEKFQFEIEDHNNRIKYMQKF